MVTTGATALGPSSMTSSSGAPGQPETNAQFASSSSQAAARTTLSQGDHDSSSKKVRVQGVGGNNKPQTDAHILWADMKETDSDGEVEHGVKMLAKGR